MLKTRNHYSHPPFSSGFQSLLAVLLLATLVLLTSCGVNPVTGKKELMLMGEDWEIATGNKHYALYQQAGGGNYAVDPNLSLYVASVGRKLAKQSRRSHLPFEFVVLNDSTPNAWALPGGKIAINRGLLIALENEAELAAVLAHEIVHVDARHSAQSQEVGTLLSIGQMASSVMLSRSEHNSGLLQHGIALAGMYGQARYSRSRETEADFYGMQYMSSAGYDPRAAITLQEKFVALSKGRNAGVFATLFASHPPSESRVAANRQTAQQLLPMGTLNRARYQQELAGLKKRQPAYDLADEAMQAIAKKAFRDALELTNRAIRIEPEEGRFHELKGIALAELNRAQDALGALDQAVRLDPGYYRPLLRRGLLRHKLKSGSAAAADLQASLKLAPSAAAYQALGEIAENNRQCRQAISYYDAAYKASQRQNQELQNKIAALQLSCQG